MMESASYHFRCFWEGVHNGWEVFPIGSDALGWMSTKLMESTLCRGRCLGRREENEWGALSININERWREGAPSRKTRSMFRNLDEKYI